MEKVIQMSEAELEELKRQKIVFAAPEIRRADIWPVDRAQYVGYCMLYYEVENGIEVTRKVFQTLTSMGIRFDGMPPYFYKTAKEAWDGYSLSLEKHLSENLGVILWRRLPELVTDPEGFWITSRLIVTEDLRFTNPLNFRVNE